MGKSKKELQQKALDYALFMISSSYFDEQPECSSPYMEKKLFLYYREVPDRSQIELEKECIAFMEKKLLAVLPDDLLGKPEKDGRAAGNAGAAKVSMIPVREHGVMEIRYETERYILRLMGRYSEKRHKAVFASQLLKRISESTVRSE